MALLFMDGFDHYNGSGIAGRKWDQYSDHNCTTPGRFGGQMGAPNRWGMFKTLSHAGIDEVIIGFAMKFVSNQYNQDHWFALWNNGSKQFQLQMNVSSGEIELATPPSPITQNISGHGVVQCATGFVPFYGQWCYMELHFKISTGLFEMYINGVAHTSVSGLNLNAAGGNVFTTMQFKSMSNFVYWNTMVFDDLYVLDKSGALNNDFLGEVRVQTKWPDAPGSRNNWTPNPVPAVLVGNAANVNIPVTDYTDWGSPAHYNLSGQVGDIDLYSIQNFTVAGEIFAVQVNGSFKKDDVGNRSVRLCTYRAAGTHHVYPAVDSIMGEYQGLTFPCYSDYTHCNAVYEIDPHTSAQWTLTDINETDFGILVKA